jgi:hypothetical protein
MACAPTGPEICNDGIDNDCVGGADCVDPACLGKACGGGALNVCTSPAVCTCGISTSTIRSVMSSARSSVTELGGRQRVVYNGGSSATYYLECTAGCSTATPTWSAQVSIGTGNGDSTTRPIIAPVGSGLAVAYRDNGTGAQYAECGGGCTSAASWSSVNIGSGDSHTLGFDVQGNVRGMVYQTDFSSSSVITTYAECTSSCLDAGSWTRVNLVPSLDPSGGAAKLQALSDGGLRRMVAAGSTGTGGVMYAECESACGSAASWTTAVFGIGSDAVIAVDRQGMPRVFSNNFSSTQEVWGYRCSGRPCDSPAKWSGQKLISDGDFVSAGSYASSETWFMTNTGPSSSATTLLLGVEDGGTYEVRSVASCSSAMAPGARPSAYLSPLDRFRVTYLNPDTSLGFFYAAP